LSKIESVTRKKLQDYRLDVGSLHLRDAISRKLNEYSATNFDKLREYYVSNKELGK